LGRFPCDPRRDRVDLFGTIFEPVRGELDGVRTEGVRLEDLGTRREIFLMDPADELGAAEVELVIANVDEDPAAV
jgi:hypothetical protein